MTLSRSFIGLLFMHPPSRKKTSINICSTTVQKAVRPELHALFEREACQIGQKAFKLLMRRLNHCAPAAREAAQRAMIRTPLVRA
jgi:hypothetical protein